ATRRLTRAVALHEPVAVVLRRDEGLLDRARADPADQVPHRTGLVVGAGRPGPAEGLLPDHRSSRLVVHVEVASRVAEGILGLEHRLPVLGEDGAREAVRRGP